MQKYLFLLFSILSVLLSYSQNVAIDQSTYTVEELVTDVLINSPCADVFNITYSTGTNFGSSNGIGYFEEQIGKFPFNQGLIMASGNAGLGGGPNPGPGQPNTGTMSWPGDPALNALVGESSFNATIIEFDFIPIASRISFRFLMASEEYDQGNFECQYSDVFAFYLTDSAGNTSNLAVLPGSNTPILVTNVHLDNGICGGPNSEYFGEYVSVGGPPVAYDGYTRPFTAFSNVNPGEQYHIKLAIADARDQQYDSAVFLEAGSFNIGLELGLDFTVANNNAVCTNDNQVLDTGLNTYVHTWYLDGVVIPGETTSVLNIDAEGTYTVEITFANNCQATDDIVVEFSQSPTANTIPDQSICDVDNDGFFSLDLSSLDTIVLGGQNNTDFSVTYHSSLTDAETNIDPLTSPYTNQVAFQQEEVFIRIENNMSPACFETSSFLFNVFEIPTANPVTYGICDNANDGDDNNGQVEFDLSTISNQVLGTQSSTLFMVSYHNNQSDADSNTSPLPMLYTNTSANSQQIVARLENINDQNCYATSVVDLVVNPLPVVTPIVILEQCDDDTDGITLFNLTEANSLISSNAINEVFTYYLTQAEAASGLITDQIINDTAYQNPTPLTGTVFARIETANGCWRTSQVDLQVGATQIPTAFNLTYNECDDATVDGDNTNGITSFNFSDATAQIEALFPVGQNITISYYTNLSNALSETNSIANPSDHRNDTSPNNQNIFVRIDSDDINACLGLGEHITLVVDPLPAANTIDPYIECSDTNEASFDFSTKNLEVIGTQTQDILISYHLSLLDAENNNNPILSPYTNISNPQTIYVRTQFDDNANGVGDGNECYSADMSFELQVIPNPVLVDPDPIRICSDQIQTVYDLTVRENQIINGDSTITIEYFESQTDLINDNPINTPSTYNSLTLNNQIIVEATGLNGCTSTTTLDLITILYAQLNNTPETIEECEIDGDGFDNFDLTRREIQILNGLNASDFIFTYYELGSDAVAGNLNSIANPSNYVNTISISQTIFVRVDPVNNECFQVAPVDLIVNRVPEIQIEDEYVICLDNSENSVDPGIDTLLPVLPIDTELNDTEYAFEWYYGDTVSAENLIVNENGSTYLPTKAGQYTIIATNLLTGCTIPATTTVRGSYPPESISVEVISPAFSENNTIEITVIGNGEYEYNVDGGPWQINNVFSNLLGGNHLVGVRDVLNCNLLNEIIEIIDYPKFFTPNGDGYNDTWNIKGIGSQVDAEIFIFDRYGKLLKQLSPRSFGWDGTFNGEILPSSDYWFVVQYTEPSDNIRKEFKAHFTLKK
ncbi:MAG: T9SS type B sorting domain-containing protein [Flavobacteriaceae bacterium]|nr:T9SS type B sorting domain-containing protein [Flavobacteriaceae bacterium]